MARNEQEMIEHEGMLRGGVVHSNAPQVFDNIFQGAGEKSISTVRVVGQIELCLP